MGAVAAWEAARRPTPNWTGKAKTARATPSTRPGVCALTGRVGDVVDARHVVSDVFMGWDRFRFRDRDPAGIGFSIPAAWAFRERVAMQQPHALIDGRWLLVTAPGLYDALERLDERGFVIVPQSRQKHLLPWAEMGTVRVDDETLSWAPAEVARLAVYARLRAVGFGEAALGERSPRWVVLSRCADPGAVLAEWPLLDPWRAHPAYLDVAARATRTPEETT